VRIDARRPLFPPTELALSTDGLLALVTDGETRNLALYRADTLGTVWERWADLPKSAAGGDVALATASGAAIVAGADSATLWILSLPLGRSTAPDPDGTLLEIDVAAPILALDLDASDPDTSGITAIHLVALTRPRGAGERLILYRRSTDAGHSWSDPDTLASGDLGRPGIFARSLYAQAVDLCFRRGDFMAWRGSRTCGRSWVDERAIRLRATPGSRNAVARRNREVLTVCENHLHQVSGATSLNSGFNWERTIAIARACDHVRLPSLDFGGGLFWVAYSQGDTAVVLRSAATPTFPRQWNDWILAADACCMGAPDVVALPDSTAGLLFGTPEGEVFFSRIRQPAER
jgi:hypothetical protein